MLIYGLRHPIYLNKRSAVQYQLQRNLAIQFSTECPLKLRKSADSTKEHVQIMDFRILFPIGIFKMADKLLCKIL